MKVAAVCTGKASKIEGKDGKSYRSGINKVPQKGWVRIGKLGLNGDEIVDKENHGGLEQAVFVMGGEDAAHWARELGRELGPGAFGENLRIDGLDTMDVHVGDNLNIGTVVLEATNPRTPCGKLRAFLGQDRDFGVRYRDSGHTGFYCRVLTTGEVEEGQAVKLEREVGSTITIGSMFKKKQGK